MRSIKTQIFISLILPFLLIGSILFMFASFYVKNNFRTTIERYAFIETNHIGNSIIDATLSKNIPLLTEMLISEHYSGTPSSFLTAFDSTGNVLAYTSLKTQPQATTIDPSMTAASGADDPAYAGHLFTIDQPLFSGSHLIGMVRVGYDFTKILSQFDRVLYALLIISIMGMATISWLALRLSHTVIRPIMELSQIATEFTHGTVPTRAVIGNSKETAILAESFNAMMQEVERSQKDLLNQKNDLEQKVAELETWQKATIGRELKMLQMKEELERMRQDAQKNPLS